jgi:hypothetical protein
MKLTNTGTNTGKHFAEYVSPEWIQWLYLHDFVNWD